MLCEVSPKFIQIASTIEEFGDLRSKTMEEVIGPLKAHEECLHSYDAKGGEYVLLARAEWKARKKKVSSRAGSPGEHARGHDNGGARGCSCGRGHGGSKHGHGRGRGNDENW